MNSRTGILFVGVEHDGAIPGIERVFEIFHD